MTGPQKLQMMIDAACLVLLSAKQADESQMDEALEKLADAVERVCK